MIHFACEHCRRPVRVDDASGGRRGRCPHCGEIVSIPARGKAIEALAAALSTDDTTAEDSASGGIPPPPTVSPRQGEDEFVLPEEGDEALDDTVILPAEGSPAPAERPAQAHPHRPATRSPAISAKRTFLLAAAVIVILAAAVVAMVLLGQMD
ncbi:MAG TPA: hypothetical protein VM389_14355 [Phycisphaerae bacterium]|nr:hypothetical protein [Phycisphaerae bacterium]